jgi:hypothetical protein
MLERGANNTWPVQLIISAVRIPSGTPSTRKSLIVRPAKLLNDCPPRVCNHTSPSLTKQNLFVIGSLFEQFDLRKELNTCEMTLVTPAG